MDRDVHERRHARVMDAWPAATLAVALALASAAALGKSHGRRSSPQTAAASDRLAGEYGLFVRFEDDSLRIGWITRVPGPGILQVSAGARVLYEDTTPAGIAHAVTIAMPPAADLLLRYGGYADAADRHETRVDLRSGLRRDDYDFAAIDSLFVIGDVHGEHDTLVAVLRNAGVIDAEGHWAAGRSRFAVVGDMTDRGADVTRVLWFLYGLERQARDAGGRVHILLGNHEIMVMLADLRYVAPKEARLAALHGVTYDRLFDPRHTLLGRWLVSKPALVRIGDVLLAHGGLSIDHRDYTLASLADTLAAFTGEDLFYSWADTTRAFPLDSAAFTRRSDFFWGPSSVFWYRGYAESDTLGAELDAVLRRFRARVHVVGHTPGRTIRQTYGGSLILTNTLPFAAELLLLVRQDGCWDRYRIGSEGPPMPLEAEGDPRCG